MKDKAKSNIKIKNSEKESEIAGRKKTKTAKEPLIR